jgi:hypothetical protein
LENTFQLIENGNYHFDATPYLSEAERCSRVAMMNEGKILVSDTPKNDVPKILSHLLQNNIEVSNEQVIVSPVTVPEFIIGKLVLYAIISLFAAALMLVAAYIIFDVAIKGSLFLLFGATLLFVIAALSLGLWVSTISDSQQVAF